MRTPRSHSGLQKGRGWRLGAIALSGGAFLLAVPGTGLAVAGSAPAGALAGRPAGTASAQRSAALPWGVDRATYRVMVAQAPLDAAANRIQLAAARPGAGHDGFFETRVDPARHLLTVVWHGTVPGDIQRLITRLRGTVRIQVVPARYGLGRLNRAISAALRNRAVVLGYPNNAGDGVHLDILATGGRAVAGGRLSRLAAALRARLGVPVTTSLSGGTRAQASCVPNSADTDGPGSRCYDLPAFWGGAVINNADYGGYCTSGFGVHNSAGHTFMLTAAHCAVTPWGYQNGVWFVNGNRTATLGQITDVPGYHDGAIIPTSTGDQYYDGPGIFSGDTYRTKTVAGQQGVSVNETLCLSGAHGGVICPMKVTATGAWVRDGNASNGKFTDMALAVTGKFDSEGRPVWTMDGDSGGPWFSLDGSTEVWAVGIHHGLTYDSQGFPNGELFTPVSVLSTDMAVWVNAP